MRIIDALFAAFLRILFVNLLNVFYIYIVMYIHQNKQWPQFTWDISKVSHVLSNIRFKQGKVIGLINTLGFKHKNISELDSLTDNVIKSSEIEGEILDLQQVRSSLARKLGVDVAGLVQSDRKIEGIVEMMLDATQNYQKQLTKKRLFDWHAGLFPTGRKGIYAINVAKWRDGKKGDMQIVSGSIGREKIHFIAPHASKVDKEMEAFFKWLNASLPIDNVLKAGIAHLWFVTIHPFEDGNGRIARAISDLLLTRSENGNRRFYSMSASIKNDRKGYYKSLEKAQSGNLDITDWLLWFLNCLDNALNHSEKSFDGVIEKSLFFEKHETKKINERQRHILNLLFDSFDGNLTSTKWAKICKCSADTALRDIQQLIQYKMLVKQDGGGRNTNYILKKVKPVKK